MNGGSRGKSESVLVASENTYFLNLSYVGCPIASGWVVVLWLGRIIYLVELEATSVVKNFKSPTRLLFIDSHLLKEEYSARQETAEKNLLGFSDGFEFGSRESATYCKSLGGCASSTSKPRSRYVALVLWWLFLWMSWIILSRSSYAFVAVNTFCIFPNSTLPIGLAIFGFSSTSGNSYFK